MLRASLFWARRRLDDFCNCVRRAGTVPEPSIPRRDGGRDPLPFLTHHVALANESSDARRAALRPQNETSVPVPPGFPGLPDRDTSLGAPPPTARAGGVSDDRRARVLGPSEGRVPNRVVTKCRPVGAWLSKRTPTTFPSSAPKGHPLSPVRSRRQEEILQVRDGPAETALPPPPREG